MKIKILKTSFLSLLVSLLLFSCVKEEYNLDKIASTEFDPNFAIHAINSRLTLWDIVNDFDSTDLLVEDATHFVSLVYQDTVFSRKAEDILVVNNHSKNISESLISATFSGDFLVEYDYNFDLNMDGNIELDSMMLKKGAFKFVISSDLSYPATFEIGFPGSTLNGQPFKKSFKYPENSIDQIDLSGVKLIFTDPANNRIPIHIKVIVHGDGSPNNSTFANFNLSMESVGFRYMFGYLGQFNLNLNNDTVGIKVYTNGVFGTVEWEDPRLQITVLNSMGMKIRTNLDYLQAQRLNEPATNVDIAGSGIPNPWDINRPFVVGDIAKTSITLNKENTNIKDALNITPQQILALLKGTTNPEGNVAKNYVQDVSQVAVEAKLELPFYGKASGFALRDTLPMNFGEDMKNIQWILFKARTTNMFPIDGFIQIYFLNSENTTIDSLFYPPEQTIVAAIPGPAPDYRVATPVIKTISQKVDGTRAKNLAKTKNIVISAKLNTINSSSQLVKIYSNYFLDVQLSFQVQTKFNTSELN